MLFRSLGGGAASSVSSGESDLELDFASVQRDNAEMERRCQEVINACSMMDSSLIEFIHDVGAGGLSNAIPELAKDSDLGVFIELSSSCSSAFKPSFSFSNVDNFTLKSFFSVSNFALTV